MEQFPAGDAQPLNRPDNRAPGHGKVMENNKDWNKPFFVYTATQ